MKSVKIPWYQKPILHNNKYINVQRGAMLAALFSFVNIYMNISLHPRKHTLSHFNEPIYSFFRFSPLQRLYLTCTVCRWQLQDRLITDITSFRMNLFMWEIDTVFIEITKFIIEFSKFHLID